MKKIYLALLCMASLTFMTACGGSDKKADASDEQETADEVMDEQADEQEADEAEEQEGDTPAQLTITADSVITDAMRAIYANGDFMPLPGVFFVDPLLGESMGEFPSKWDLLNGSAEVREFEGRKVIWMANNDTEVTPNVVGNSRNYLPEVFTFEFEYYCNGEEDFNACYHIQLAKEGDFFDDIRLATEESVSWSLAKTDDNSLSGEYSELSTVENKNSWNHFALSFNKGTLKMYVNGKRIVSLPNVKAPRFISIRGEGWDDHRYCFGNVRMTTGVQ